MEGFWALTGGLGVERGKKGSIRIRSRKGEGRREKGVGAGGRVWRITLSKSAK